MPLTTRILLARRILVGDRILTTTGMREVLHVEHLHWPRSARPYRVNLTVQDVLSASGTVVSFEPHASVQTQREVPAEDPLAQARAVFLNHYCFESGATKADAEAAWAQLQRRGEST